MCYCKVRILLDFPGGSGGKASAYNVGYLGLIPALGRSPGEGNGNPFQSSCLENPMDRGAWQATVHRVAKSWTRLSEFTSLHLRDTIGEGNGSLLQHSCLENLMDRGAWWAIVHGVTKSKTWLKWFSTAQEYYVTRVLEENGAHACQTK